MINWIKKILGLEEAQEFIEWKTETSILRYLVTNLDGNGKIRNTAHDLPDENREDEDENKLRYAPGLFDVMYGSADSSASKSRIDELADLLRNIAHHGDEKSESIFYRSITSNENIINIIDAILERLVSLSMPIEPFLFNFAKNLAFKTNHRNSVKFGIAILGLCNTKSVLNEIKILGLHDEFTIYSAIAIANLSDNLVNDLWDIAQKVEGWGKIQIVSRLIKMELASEIQDWLLISGYKNSIMNEYLAYTCAVHGQLKNKLNTNHIDEKLYNAAREIIDALITGGPAENMSDYEHAAAVVAYFLRHAKEHVSKLADYISMNLLKGFLLDLQKDNSMHTKNGWTQDNITKCLLDVIAIIESKDWTEMTMSALTSNDSELYWKGKRAAKTLNIDIWNIVWEKLQNNPSDSSLWYDVTHEAKPEMADMVIDYAIKTIPLNDLSTGPKDAFGLGLKYVKHQSLEYVITFLENYPNMGEQIILTGLNSPVTRNRNMAIRVLDKWKKKNWSPEILKQVHKLQAIEPNQTTKENIEKLLREEELK